MAHRLLVVGGDHAVVESLRGQRSLADFDYELAAGGVDALRRLRRKAFAAVMTSPRTSVEEDLAMLAEMRQVRPGVPAILLAPKTTRDDVIAALRAEVFGCFSAPFDWAEIASMVLAAGRDSRWRECIEVLSATRDWVSLRVSSRLVTAERLTQFMRELAADQPGDNREHLVLAFREMLLNAMEHGAGFDPEKVIEVSAIRTERAIVYHFRDPGPGFSRDEQRHVVRSGTPEDIAVSAQHREEAGLRPGGFGMLLVRQLIDEVIYNENGNQVILVKHTK